MRKTMIVVATAALAVGSTSLSTSASAFGLVRLGGFGLVHPGFGVAHPGFGLAHPGFGPAHVGGGYGLGHLSGSLGGRRFGSWPSYGGYSYGGGPYYGGYAYGREPYYGDYANGGGPYYGDSARAYHTRSGRHTRRPAHTATLRLAAHHERR